MNLDYIIFRLLRIAKSLSCAYGLRVDREVTMLLQGSYLLKIETNIETNSSL
jgi:hypothetical protein